MDAGMIITLIVGILGAFAAIFGLGKAIAEYKKAKRENETTGGDDMVTEHKSEGNDIGNSTINGDVTSISDAEEVTNAKNIIYGDISVYGDNTKISSDTNKESTELNDDDKSKEINEGILLKDSYTSLFAEDGSIHSERIIIRNLGNGKIEGDVFLDDSNKYKLNGTFKNRILTGEYISTGKYTDERGTINLKLISENVLSGFCSFSKISVSLEDQIRVSPYVWVAGEDAELAKGTYEFCTHCHNEGKKCCCYSDEVDMPVILLSEAQKYQAMNPKRQKMRNFSHTIGKSTIRQINYAGSNTEHCYFYNAVENKCKIYDVRPTDCRIFPFDIKRNEKTGEYWVGYYDEVCDRNLPDKNTMKQYAHILRPQLFLLFPYSEVINCDEVCHRLKQTHFEELFKLYDFIF